MEPAVAMRAEARFQFLILGYLEEEKKLAEDYELSIPHFRIPKHVRKQPFPEYQHLSIPHFRILTGYKWFTNGFKLSIPHFRIRGANGSYSIKVEGVFQFLILGYTSAVSRTAVAPCAFQFLILGYETTKCFAVFGRK